MAAFKRGGKGGMGGGGGQNKRGRAGGRGKSLLNLINGRIKINGGSRNFKISVNVGNE